MRRSRVVLLVDPQDDRRVTFQVVLRREGYAVLEAADATEALAQVREAAPDLIIVYMQLPRLSGASLIRMLRNEDHGRYGILAIGEETSRCEASSAGADEFHAEPIGQERLIRTVTALIGRA